MKKIIKTLLVLVVFIFQINFSSAFFLKEDIISTIVTFYSILFGFYITSLAIFATSSFMSNLYKTRDLEQKNKTLLNVLIDRYKWALGFSLVSIAYLLAVQLKISQEPTGQLAFSDFLLLPLGIVIFINFLLCFEMLDYLLKITIQQAKKFK